MGKKIRGIFPLPIIFVTILLVLFTFIIPPFQKPDEPVHFYWTMALLNGTTKCSSDDISAFFPISDSVFTFPEKMNWNTIIMRPDAKFPIGVFKGNYPFRGDTTRSGRSIYCYLPKLPYIPQMISALMSFPFNNLLVTFYMMRVSSAVVFIIALLLSLGVLPKQYRNIFLWFSSIPMLLHQVSAVSYDGVSISFMMLLTALFLSYISKKKNSLKEVFVLSTLFLITFISKSGYIGFIVLPVIVFFRLPMVARNKWRVMKIFLGFIIAVILLSFTPLKDIVFQSAASYQHQLILKDPLYFFSVLGRTLWDDQNILITGLFGTFGWLEYGLPMGIISGYIAAGVYVFITTFKNDSKMLRPQEALFILIAIFGNILLLFYHFYLHETPVAYKVIFGFQGRYVLPLLPLFLISIIQMLLYINADVRKKIFSMVFGVGCFFTIAAIIYLRYYDFSKSFSNPDELKIAVEKNMLDTSTLVEIPITGNEQFIYEVKYPNYKIGGFQMLIANETSVNVPYRYTILDTSCKRILQSGYLDNVVNERKKFLRREKEITYTQYIPITKIPDPSICINIRPVFMKASDTGLILLGESKPLIQFLYIAQ